WEINEAFAVVPLKTMRDLEIDPTKVNVNGGAIALGHPVGATGAILLGSALRGLGRRELAAGLLPPCIGGGRGIATSVERVEGTPVPVTEMAGGYSWRYCLPTAASANGSLGFHRHGPLWATAATANCRIVAICAGSRGVVKAWAAAKAASCSPG